MDAIIFLGYEILTSFVPFLVVLMILRTAQKIKGTSFSRYHLFTLLAFYIYIISVYHFTGAGTIYEGIRYQLELRQEQINFVPFSQKIDITAYLLNILLFIPLGLLAPIIWQKMNKLTNVIGISFFFTTLIETSQLLNNRRTDIDDIILNVLGGMIGFGFFKVFDKITKSKFRVGNLITVELTIYIMVIFVGRFLFFNEMGLAILLYGF